MAHEQTAPRFKKPGLRDPRLLVGVLIIVLSILATVGLIRATNQTEPYYAVSKDLGIGDRISRENVQVVQVRLGDAAPQYISAEQDLAEGLVATRPLKAGEILSPNAVSSEVSEGRRLVTLLLDQYAVSGFSAGNRVDIWVSRKEEGSNSFGDPEPIVEGAEIHSVTAQESIIGGTGRSAVEVWVNNEYLSQVLGASNDGSVINLVPSAYESGRQ
ncbi:SAF domain-containing protein [Rothia sp. P5766]|uniref:SAF domain-containing protein n=1 Tax=Rothia sp. P5766 TaxID=3402656 RepID=UPI003ADDEA53